MTWYGQRPRSRWRLALLPPCRIASTKPLLLVYQVSRGWTADLPRKTPSLTENEGALLALVSRAEPVTSYQIAKAYEQSPVSNFSTSRGKLYPMIRRLREAGLLRASLIKGDGRKTERLATTDKGRAALREWIKDIRPALLLPEDPLRTRLQSIDLLPRGEQVAWVARLKVSLLEKLDQVEAYGRSVSGPYHELVHDNAVRSIRGRMDWLDLVLHHLVVDRDEHD
jgi:DNA-binding PadR family transcriptional regulator